MHWVVVLAISFALSYGEIQLSNNKNATCTRACVLNDNCLNLLRGMSLVHMTPLECRTCIANRCGPYDRANRGTPADCLMESKATCPGCPMLSSKEDMKRVDCNKCIDECGPKILLGSQS
uniref:uncharacterized protein LOC104266425 isoform X2 n=1 Tax=Ciona intestinalis TaxID=7719 RepID=UPI000521842C|nr:uncharacterized protein LOC104266425 isoform X2 [Ciona intestinalis]|eukprot:XP_009860882.1 uncharacterized protein LOC104266425 isoform X2 [Ciona intestinalis]